MKFSKYSFRLILLYIFLTPIIVWYSIKFLDFSLTFHKTSIIISVTSILVFIIILASLEYKIKNLFPNILFSIIYGLIFAIPEEIIFRGLIQRILGLYINNIGFLIIMSALIFGLAHLPHGAKGLRVNMWNWRYFIMTFLAGIPLGLTYIFTNSLFFPIVLHTAFIVIVMVFNFKLE